MNIWPASRNNDPITHGQRTEYRRIMLSDAMVNDGQITPIHSSRVDHN